jgi:hypothetical protein
MLVSDPRELIEPAAGEQTQAIEMRFQVTEVVRCQVKRKEIPQSAIDGVKVPPRAIGRDVVRAAIHSRCVQTMSRERIHH